MVEYYPLGSVATKCYNLKMGQRKTPFINNELYHIFNRGVDKKEIFIEKEDYFRFIEEIKEFNIDRPIGSLYELSFERKKLDKKSAFGSDATKLVDIIAYNINPNHFHLILKQKKMVESENLCKKLEQAM